MTDNSLTLVRPIKVGSATVSALALDAGFRVGWLRGAPKTPTWLIAVVRSLLASLPEDMTEADIRGDNKALFANFPSPSAEELDEVIPWLLHIAGRAMGQPPEVIDQLDIADLFAITMRLMPGMGALPNFQTTSGTGSGTSPGSSIGAPLTSTT